MVLIVVGLAIIFFVAGALGVQNVGASENRRRLTRIATSLFSTVTFVGTIVSGQKVITGIASTKGILPGMQVYCPPHVGYLHLPSFVSAVTASTVTLSADALTSTASASFLAVGGPGSNAQVHLFQYPYAGGLDPAPSDFVEATFTGYLAQALNPPSLAYTTASGSAEVNLGSYSWVLGSTPATGNQIGGYWVDYESTTTTATVVSFWESFANQVPMTVTGNATNFALPLDIPLPSSARQF